MSGRSSTIEIQISKVKARTDKAALCEIDGQEIWLPLSQCNDGGAENWSPAVGDEDITVEIPEWLAEEKELL